MIPIHDTDVNQRAPWEKEQWGMCGFDAPPPTQHTHTHTHTPVPLRKPSLWVDDALKSWLCCLCVPDHVGRLSHPASPVNLSHVTTEA